MAQAPAPAQAGRPATGQPATGQPATGQPATGQPATGQPAPASGAPPAGTGVGLLTELKVSGHMMTLETGLYCIIHKPAAGVPAPSGLPGLRVSLPPAASQDHDRVEVASFRADGWLAPSGDAALVRVTAGPAQVLVTIYQTSNAAERTAPSVQVMKLAEASPAAPRAAPAVEPPRAPAEVARPAPPRGPAVMEMIAHIQERGDVGAMFGEWLGERGSQRWIEGFGLSPTHDIDPREIEYQAVLGQGWLSPWVEGGQFCGSRAMALPLLGLRVRLTGEAQRAHEVVYSASFVDGTSVGPVQDGAPCEAESLAAMEAFQVLVRQRETAEEPAKPARAKPSGRKR